MNNGRGKAGLARGRRLHGEVADSTKGGEIPSPSIFCAICDHIRELHELPFVECSHPFTPKSSPQPMSKANRKMRAVGLGTATMAAGKTTVRYDALARIAKAVKRIREQPEAAHGDGCRRTQPPSSHEEPLEIPRFLRKYDD